MEKCRKNADNAGKNAEEFNCETCDFKCCKLSEWSRHIGTRKHLGIKKILPQKNAEIICEKCNVTCSKMSNWSKHILTAKHLNNIKNAEKSATSCLLSENIEDMDSNNQIMKNINTGLLNLICEQTKTMEKIANQNAEQTKTMEKIANQNAELQKQNAELVNKALELCKPVTINQTNNNNNKFNINVFLNEQCKDAINFTDFIKNIEVSREDLENNAQLGFVSGISKIFLDNLKQLGINERPIHCTDTKRETMYIKDENIWTKQPDDSKLQKAIQTVSYRSIGKLQEWKQENPEYQDVNSEFSEKCLDMQRNTMAGSNREVYYPKVIHVLAKETMVDK
jgi:hypothetical protein